MEDIEPSPDRPTTKAAAQALHGSLHRGRAGRAMPRGKHSTRMTVAEEETISIEGELEELPSLPFSHRVQEQPSTTSATSAESLRELTPTPNLTYEEMIPRSRLPLANEEPLGTTSVLTLLKEMFGMTQEGAENMNNQIMVNCEQDRIA